MQTTKVAEASSLSWLGAKGSSLMVNESELSPKHKDRTLWRLKDGRKSERWFVMNQIGFETLLLT
ncbi:MAG: hypothetical protein V7K14_01190, partial [Nostoc sp.]|uniref:hypothetical protein n=1 Tax=Nostoc sp. TaxID=1180 RepID=UPI002FF797BA